MSDPTLLVSLASAGTMAVALTAAAALKGWRQWLDLRRAELDRRGGRARPAAGPLADLRARVRRLEAIADGMDS